MDLLAPAAQIAACVALPGLLDYAAKRVAWVQAVGPVVLCYALGIAAATVLPMRTAAAQGLAGAALVFGLPLLLFGADVRGWLRSAPRAVAAFAMMLAVVTAWGLVAGALFAHALPDAPAAAGMFVGTYTGSTANMAAVSRALSVPTERFVVINAADLLVGVTWLAALLSFAPRLVGRFLPPTPPLPSAPAPPTVQTTRAGWLAGPLLAGGCIGVGVLAGELLPEQRDAATLLGLSLAASALSFVPRVRHLPGTAAVGRYAMLVFCVAAGTLTDVGALVGGQWQLVAMAALIMYGAIFSHLALCRLAGIDRDTALISGAAAIMGPALIPPIVEAMGNRDVLLTGLSTALVGLTVGTWLGVGVAWALG